MKNKPSVVAIYPAGRGHYALGSPDGEVLLPGRPLTVLVAGHEISGIIQAHSLGDYLRADDGTTCGLCAYMRVVFSPSESKAEVVR